MTRIGPSIRYRIQPPSWLSKPETRCFTAGYGWHSRRPLGRLKPWSYGGRKSADPDVIAYCNDHALRCRAIFRTVRGCGDRSEARLAYLTHRTGFPDFARAA